MLVHFIGFELNPVHLPQAITPPETNMTVGINKAGGFWPLFEDNNQKSSCQHKSRCYKQCWDFPGGKTEVKICGIELGKQRGRKEKKIQLHLILIIKVGVQLGSSKTCVLSFATASLSDLGGVS